MLINITVDAETKVAVATPISGGKLRSDRGILSPSFAAVSPTGSCWPPEKPELIDRRQIHKTHIPFFIITLHIDCGIGLFYYNISNNTNII
jgi:hypothetical protein